jgi:threonine synthase
LERHYGLRQLYLKFEGGNPTGTQKDRIAFAQVNDALRRGFDRVVVASCGNYGAAVALASARAGVACEVVLPRTYKAPREAEIRKLGATVVRLGEDYEEAVVLARARAAEREAYDANPGGPNVVVQLNAYGQIAWEIFYDLADAPRAVAVSVSNGSTLAGIWRGFERLERRGRTSRKPWMVAGSTFRKNPIVAAFRRGLHDVPDLRPDAVRETAVNEPLVNWHAEDGELALHAIYASSGWAGDVTDKRMKELAREIREMQGLDVQPASTAGLAALLERHAEAPLPPDRYVAVLTGRAG